MSVLTIVNQPFFPEGDDVQDQLTEPLLNMSSSHSNRLSLLGSPFPEEQFENPHEESMSVSDAYQAYSNQARSRRKDKLECKRKSKIVLLSLTSVMSCFLFYLLIQNALKLSFVK